MNEQYSDQYPAPMPAPRPKKKRTGLKVVGGVIALAFAFGIGMSAANTPTKTVSTATGPATTVTATATTTAPAPAAQAPTQAAAVEPVTSGSWTSGTYQVVKSASNANQISAGRLTTAGPDKSSLMPSCYWARTKDDSGDFKAIISNGNIQGPGSVTVKVGEFLELSGSCVWTK